MNKRKNQAGVSNDEAKEEGNSKQARAEGAAAAASGSSSAPSRFPTAEAINQAQLTSLRVVNTVKLIDAMESSKPLLERVQAVCKLLEEGAKGSECHFDMSMREDEGDVKSKPALFLLLRLIWECLPDRGEAGDVIARRKEAGQVLWETLRPLFPTLLLAFDPTVTDAKTGNNALHEMLSLMYPASPDDWAALLIYQMLQRGVNLDARNFSGHTPLLTRAAGVTDGRACVFRVLSELGADINAQDNDGNSLLHHLIREKKVTMLEDLFIGDGKGVSELDFALQNKQGQTALDLAAVMHAQEESEKTRKIHRLIRAQVQEWRKKIRPLILQSLTEPMIPELAQLTMSYVDGSGPPFTAVEAAEQE